MKYIKFLLIPFFLFFGTHSWAGLDSSLDLSFDQEDDFASLEKELEETSQAIDEYVSTLSPEEQENFNQEVEKMTKMIENMSEDEFSEFLGEVFSEESPIEEEPVDEKEEETVEIEEEVPTPEPQEKGKQSQAISLIDSIITHTNSFVVKIASSSDLPGKIEFWGKQGTIKEWPATLVWKDFKVQLENFSQKLYRMKDKDSQTKKYKYIDDFIKDETLYNNLAQLKTKIAQYEPMIEIPEFGLEKLSNESKQATQKVANAFTEAFYTLKIPQALQELFEKYEPEAKKARAQEEEAEKKAAAQLKRQPIPERALVAGREMEGADFGYPRTPTYGSTSPGYSPAYTPRPARSARPVTAPTDDRKPGKPSRPGRPGIPGKPKTEEKEEEKEEKAKVPEKIDPDSERLLYKIEANLTEVVSMVEKNEKLKDIETHLTSGEPVDQVLTIIEIPTIKRRMNEIISDIKALNRRVQLLGSVQKRYYKEGLQNLVDKHKEPLKKVADAIDAVEKKVETDAAFDKSITDEKKYVYLGDEQAIDRITKRAPADAKAIKETIPHPTSLYTLRDTIQDLIKTAKDFSIEKAKKPGPVPPGRK